MVINVRIHYFGAYIIICIGESCVLLGRLIVGKRLLEWVRESRMANRQQSIGVRQPVLLTYCRGRFGKNFDDKNLNPSA